MVRNSFLHVKIVVFWLRFHWNLFVRVHRITMAKSTDVYMYHSGSIDYVPVFYQFYSHPMIYNRHWLEYVRIMPRLCEQFITSVIAFDEICISISVLSIWLRACTYPQRGYSDRRGGRGVKGEGKLPVYTTATRSISIAKATKISKPQNNHYVKKLVL